MVRITILLVMYINCLSKYSVYLRWPSLICDVDRSLRLVRPLLNGQYNVSNSLQTIIYIFSILDLPRNDLGRDLREKCGAVLLFEAGDDEPRISMYGPYILIYLPMTWKRIWNDQTIRRQLYMQGRKLYKPLRDCLYHQAEGACSELMQNHGCCPRLRLLVVAS